MNNENFESSQILKPTREQLEAQYPQFVELVKNAKTSDELVEALNVINKTISGYFSEDIIDLSKLVIGDKKGVPNIIKNSFTRTFGFRDKVVELASSAVKQ